MQDFQGQGFYLTETKREPVTLALLSLKTALQSYFETFKVFRRDWHLLDKANALHSEYDAKVFYKQTIGGIRYFEHYIETIVHFHHFTEIICVELLRMEHPLLVTEKCINGEDHKSVHKRVIKLPHTPRTDHTIKFESTVKRLYVLINEKVKDRVRLNNSNLSFFDETTKKGLLKLHKLRNELLHQGTFVLEYEYLDAFVGTTVLPFVHNVTSLPEFSIYERIWKYPNISCRKKNGQKIDPIMDIISACGSTYDYGYVGLLKEFGRSAYLNFIPENEPPKKGFGSSSQNFARLTANAKVVEALKEDEVFTVTNCLVCGAKTLLLYRHGENDIPLTVIAVECLNCTFHVDHRLENPSYYGIDAEDLWIPI